MIPGPTATTKDHAFSYASLGLAVVPFHSFVTWGRPTRACTCELGLRCSRPGNHPRIKAFQQHASTDQAQIQKWWDRWPHANVAVLTGTRSNVVVLDLDTRNGGLHTRAQLENKFGQLPKTPTARSGGGGLHVWFRHPGTTVPSGDGLLGPGADVKADGTKTITMPPSLHKSGGKYAWTELNFDTVELAPLPQWMIGQIIETQSTGIPAVSSTQAGLPHSYRMPLLPGQAYKLPDRIANGRRNDELHRYACSLWGRGEATDYIWSAVESANRARCDEPLPTSEIERLLASAFRLPRGAAPVVRRPDVISPAPPWPTEDDMPYAVHAKSRMRRVEPDPESTEQEMLPFGMPHIDDEQEVETTEPSDDHDHANSRLGESGRGSDGAPELLGPDGIPMTDIGNAERVYRDSGTDLRYVNRYWYMWTGTHWQVDDLNRVKRRAAITARRMSKASAKCRDDSQRKTWVNHIRRSESARGLGCTLECLSMFEGIARKASDVDCPGDDVINTPSGMLNLRSLNLDPHQREPMVTKVTAAPYDGTAACGLWESFLNDVMCGDQEMIAFLQRAVGYSLTGYTTEHCLFLLDGDGDNGKSTFMDTILKIFGDYGAVADFSTWLGAQREDRPRYDLAMLSGARLVTSSEPSRGACFNDGIVKNATGGESITCRHMYRDLTTYTPQFKAWFSGNHKPNTTDASDGFWRRFRIIRFEAKFSNEKKRDKDLKAKLIAEGPGIFAWAARGAAEWFRLGGLNPPGKVLHATEQYRTEQDPLAQFIRDVLRPTPGAECLLIATVFDEYIKWCEDGGHSQPMTKASLGQELRRRGLTSYKKSGERVYRNWKLARE